MKTVDLSERVTATYYDDEHEEWSQKTVTIFDVLDSVCDDYTVIEAEPVKHGRWLRTDAYPHRIYCSECYATFIRNDEFLHLEDIPHDYCPNCGARMVDGAEE